MNLRLTDEEKNELSSEWLRYHGGYERVTQMNSPRRGSQAALAILANGPVATKAQASSCTALKCLVLARLPRIEVFSGLGATRCTKTKTDYRDQARSHPSRTDTSHGCGHRRPRTRQVCRNTQCWLISGWHSLPRYVTLLPFLHSHGLPK